MVFFFYRKVPLPCDPPAPGELGAWVAAVQPMFRPPSPTPCILPHDPLPVPQTYLKRGALMSEQAPAPGVVN